jgi:hypothetical protein
MKNNQLIKTSLEGIVLTVTVVLLTGCASDKSQETAPREAMSQQPASPPLVAQAPVKQPLIATSGSVQVIALVSSSSTAPDDSPGHFVHSEFHYAKSNFKVGESTLTEIRKTLGSNDTEPPSQSSFPVGLQARRWNSVVFSTKGYTLYGNETPQPLTLFFSTDGLLKGFVESRE